MRRAARTDRNHAEIVTALTEAGCRVQSLASVGGGVPDLLVEVGGRLLLIEVKDGSKSPSRRKLTDEQQAWHEAWQGAPVYVIEDVGQAVECVGKAKELG